MTRSEQIIWLAGLLEGEGSFRVSGDSRNQKWRPCLRVRVEMSDRDIIERASKVMYSPSRVRICPSRNPKWSETYAYQWSGADAEQVMRAVLPFMGERRTQKIQECLATSNLSHYPKGNA